MRTVIFRGLTWLLLAGVAVAAPATFRIPAGSYRTLTWDPGRGFVELLEPREETSVLPDAQRIPAWLREDVREQLDRLLHAPLREAKGPAIPTFEDVDGDGLRDMVLVAEDGAILWRRNRGLSGLLVFGREPVRYFPHRVGAASRPAVLGKIVRIGGLDDGVHVFERTGEGDFAEILERPFDRRNHLPGGAFFAPTQGDLDGDGRPEVVLGLSDASPLIFGLSDSPWMEISGSYCSPCLVDLDGDGDLDLLCGDRDGRLRLHRNTGTREKPVFEVDTSDPELAAIDVGDSSAPTAGDIDHDGDVDLIVGNQAGELRLFLGPDWTEDPHAFAGLDVGELAAPALALTEDGEVAVPLRLLVGRLEGDVLHYLGETSPDGVRFTESLSWAFTPQQTAKTLEDYYTKNYFPEAEERRGPIDPETRDAYVRLLRETPDDLVDEVAFSIAHTPAEVLRAMHRLGQSELLLENARAIRDMAAKVAYARLVETPDGTTIAYARGPGDWVEAPRDVYYWWVVHPRLLFEIPCRVDASWWETSAKERGLTDSKWWKHDEAVQTPSPEGIFWRPAIAHDDRFGSKLVDRAAKAETLRGALEAVSTFVSHGPGLMRFGYETQDLQPWLIFAKHYGSCGEHSIIGAACARTMLIPTSIVGCRGEDHQWNEWWDTDGEWHQWDACSGNIDNPYYEGREHQGKTISTISRWWGNDRLDATTTSVFNPPDAGYTTSGRGYTDVAEVAVRVVDAAGAPIDGAIVILRSHWENRNLVTFWGYTDGRGVARFELGYEPNGGYTIEALTPFGSAGVQSFPVEEGRAYELVLATPRARSDPLSRVTRGEPRRRSRPGEEVGARLLRARIRPPSPLTSSRYRIGSYMTDAHGYRGTRGCPIDVDPGDLPEVLVFSPEEFEKLERAEDCVAMYRGGFDPDGRATWPFPRDRAHVVVISNLRAVWTEIAVEVETQPGGPDRVAPTVRLDGDGLEATRGTVVVVTGEARDDVGVVGLRLHCSAWPDERSLEVTGLASDGTFRVELDTGAGGPWPAGEYGVIAVATDASGNEARSYPVPLRLAPARVFEDQRIRQDDPDDPLSGEVWTYGPFDLAEGERFLLIRTSSLAEGFDCDVHLYRDRNGNGRLDGAGEKVKSSTSPTAMERIYLEAPPAGTYWLRCQGWKVEGEFAPLRVDLFPAGTARAVVDLAPVGPLRAVPGRLRARFLPFARVDAASVRVSLDGRDVTSACRIDGTGLEMALPPGLVVDTPHEVVVAGRHQSGRKESRTWSFEVDTRPPELEILSPEAGAAVGGKVRIEVSVGEEAGPVTVVARIEGEAEKKLRKVKGRPGVMAVEVDTTGWAEGERFVWLVARDAVGNACERVLRLRK